MNWLDSLVQEYRAKDEFFDMFGVVVYTAEHPHVKKVLRDKDYWEALHESSGENFAIFSIRPKSGERQSSAVWGGGYRMIGMWEEPRENLEILEKLRVDSTEHLPLFVSFTDLLGGVVKIEYKIAHSSVEEAYNSLSDSIVSPFMQGSRSRPSVA